MSDGAAQNGGTQAASTGEAAAVAGAAVAATTAAAAPAAPQAAVAAPAAPVQAAAAVATPAAAIAPVAAAAVQAAAAAPAAADCAPPKKKVSNKHDRKETEEEHARATDSDEDQNLSQPADGCVLPQTGEAAAAPVQDGTASTPVYDDGTGGGISSGLLIGAGVLAAVGVGALVLLKDDEDENRPPVATADTAAVNEGASLNGSVATNDSDPDGDPLTFALSGTAPAGLTFNPNGTYVFDANNAAYNGLAAGATQVLTIPYTVSDGRGGSATSTLTITITGTNDAPTVVADTAAVNEDASITGNLRTNDSDPDTGATLTYTVVGTPPAGLTLNADGTYTFDASNAAYQDLAVGETRVVTVNVAVSDGTAPAVNTTLTITVTGTNDAPVATADVDTAVEGGDVVTGSVATNDTDVDGDELTFELDEPVAGLTLNADGSYSFDPSDAAYDDLAAGETREVVATYTVSDGNGGTDSATLTITVTGTADGPVAVPDTAEAEEDGAIVTGSLAANDDLADAVDPVVYELEEPVAGLTVNADGTFSFDPSNAAYDALAEGETQTVIANYTVTDADGVTSTSTLTITVTGTNDAPIAVADVDAGVEGDGILTGSVADNDSDADDGAELTYTLDEPVAGLTLNEDGTYSFDLNDPAYNDLAVGEEREVVATYTVSDGEGGTSTSTLTITVTGSNDAPVAVDDTDTAVEDGAIVTGSVAANDSDPDTSDELTYSLDEPVAGLTLNADGSYSFDPTDAAYDDIADGETRTVVATYTVSDGNGGTDTATLTITVTGTNDAPIAVADVDAGVEGDGILTGSVADNDSDADDGAELTYTLDEPVAGLTLNEDGTYSFDLNDPAYNDLAVGEEREVVATYTVSDGEGGTSTSTLTITVTGSNDAPVAVDDTDTAVEDGAIVTGSVAANDSDPDTSDELTYSLDEPVAGLTLNADGSYSFDPTDAAYDDIADGETRTVVATYTVSDGNGGTDTATLTITVTGTAEGPIAAPDTATATEDGAVVTGSLAANDDLTEADAPVNYALVNAVAGLTVNADGTFSFDPSDAAYDDLAEGETREVVATYSVTDADGRSSTSTLTITVTGTNDAPVAVATAVAATEGVTPPVTGTLGATDADDGDELTFTLNDPVPGLTVNADGTFSFDPTDPAYESLAEGEQQVIEAEFTVTDAEGETSTSTLTITVTGTNDAPVAEAATVSAVEDAAPVTGTVVATDVDNDAVLTYSLNEEVPGLTLNADGTFSFDPSNAAYDALAAGEVLTIEADFTATDEEGATSTSTITITVTGTNDAPVAVADVDAGLENSLISGTVADNDTDADTPASELTYTVVGTAPAGFVLNADGSYTLDTTNPVYQSILAGEVQDVVVEYQVDDGQGGVSTSTLTISVTGVATAVDLDVDSDDDLNTPEVFDAADGDFIFSDDDDIENTVIIDNFGDDDVISFDAPFAGANQVAFANVDYDGDGIANDLEIAINKNGDVSSIILRNVLTDEQAEGIISNEAEAEAAIGVGFDNFRSTADDGTVVTPPGDTAASLDFDSDNNTNTAQLFDAGTDGFAFTDDADIESEALIVNFGADDRITFLDTTESSRPAYTNDALDGDGLANDLIITFNKGGTSSSIVIKDVVSPDAFIFDEEGANAEINSALGTLNVDYFVIA
nr:Ig-like domain-containing protein [uncultured Sphingomonas sp.]